MQNIIAPMLGATKILKPVLYYSWYFSKRFGTGLVNPEYRNGWMYYYWDNYFLWYNEINGISTEGIGDGSIYNYYPGEPYMTNVIVTPKSFKYNYSKIISGYIPGNIKLSLYPGIDSHPEDISYSPGDGPGDSVYYISREYMLRKDDNIFKPGTKYLFYPIDSLFNLLDLETKLVSGGYNNYHYTFTTIKNKPTYKDTKELVKSPKEFIEHIQVDWSATPKEIYLTPGEYFTYRIDWDPTHDDGYGYKNCYFDNVFPFGDWCVVEAE